MKMNVDFLEGLLSRVSRHAGHRPGGKRRGEASPGVPQLAAACSTLLSGGGGEASQILVAQQVLVGYGDLDASDRCAFLAMLAERYGASPESIHAAYCRSTPAIPAARSSTSWAMPNPSCMSARPSGRRKPTASARKAAWYMWRAWARPATAA